MMEVNNIQDVLGLAGALYAVANIVVRLTPTKKDDEVLGKLGKILNFLFLARNVKKG
jgi:hypothetical protein